MELYYACDESLSRFLYVFSESVVLVRVEYDVTRPFPTPMGIIIRNVWR